MKDKNAIIPNSQLLLSDLCQIIDGARSRVASSVNHEMTMMYWHIGERINRDVLDNQRDEYGKQIVAQVARQLQEQYGNKGFDVSNIRRMMQFGGRNPNVKRICPKGPYCQNYDNENCSCLD